ncbi:hypothetical protein [Pseudomonas fluorescens]|nr:hypothetical protein [Pseudomonas fluorescens]
MKSGLKLNRGEHFPAVAAFYLEALVLGDLLSMTDVGFDNVPDKLCAI